MNNTIFRPRWLPSLLVAALVPLFCYLGIWQLDRAEQKRSLMEQQQARTRLPPLELTGTLQDSADLRYRSVNASGQYDGEHQFLLDNQIAKGKAGYHVLTPLRLNGGGAVLVNRGWVPRGLSPVKATEIPAPGGTVKIVGTIDRFPSVGLRLAGAEIPGAGWPSLIQLAEPARLAERLGYPLLPYQVLLAPAENGGFQRSWMQVDLHPEVSQGYALQWFSFAAATLVLYLWYGLRKTRGRTGTSTDTQ